LADLDRLVEDREGKIQSAGFQWQRGLSYARAGRYEDGLRYLRKAYHNYVVTGRPESIAVAVHLASVHRDLGLYGATKYYALAGAVQALSLSHLDSRAEGICALALAGLADAAHGATGSMIMLTRRLWEARADYKGEMTGYEEEELRDILILTVYMAQLVSKPMFERFKAAIPLLNNEKETLATFARLGLVGMNLDEVKGRLKDIGCPVPFSDMVSQRRIVWVQAGDLPPESVHGMIRQVS